MTLFIDPATLLGLTRNLLERSGSDAAQARLVAESLVWSDRIGRATHGVWRLPSVCARLRSGAINGGARPKLQQNASALAMLDGDGGSGHYTGALAVDAACDMASRHGLGAVGVLRSNHFGVAAWFVERAAARGYICLATSNSFAKVAAHGGLRPVLGTNPLAFGAPRQNGHSILVDFATSALAGSEVIQRAEVGGGLQPGQAIDAQGKPLLDAAGLSKGALLPFGGAKGFGLSLLVEILSGVLTGAAVGTQVRSMFNQLDSWGENGHFFMTLNVASCMPLDAYFERMEDLIHMLQASGAAAGDVRYPGEARWAALERTDREGIAIAPATREKLDALARELSVALPW